MKKRIICILLLVIMLFSICSCIKSGKKYDYNMKKYVTIGKYSGFDIEVPLDDIQYTLDTEIMAFATEYEVDDDDIVFVDITVTEVIYLDKGDGTLIDQRGEVLEELTEKDMQLKVGSFDYAARVEQAIVGTSVGETTKLKTTLPSTFKVEKYRGREVYIDIKVTSKLCEIGDVIAVAFDGYYLDKDGKRIPNPDKKAESDNEYKTFVEGSKSAFYLGAHAAIDGFEEAIIGMKIGETKTIQIDIPEDYYFEDVRGQKAEFVITAKEAFTPPVFDDKFVKTYCEYINNYYLDYRRYKSYTNTTDLLADFKREYILDKIFEKLDSEIEITKYPRIEYKEALKELEDMEETFEKTYGTTLDKYLDANFGQTREEYVKANMSLEMVYYAIAQAEGIELTTEELLQETDNLISYYKNLYMINNNLDEATAKKQAQSFVESMGPSYVYENAMFKKVDDLLINNNKIITIDKTYTSITETIADASKPVEK